MKKLIIMLLLIASGSSYAQITLENIYAPGNVPQDYLRLVKLSSSGYKYVIYDTSTITLFNLNHTVFKTINIPPTGGLLNFQQLKVYYISEELFNTNPSDVEYFVFYGDINGIGHSRVYDELGNVLFSKDTTNMSTVMQVGGFEDFISYTTSGCKMIVYLGNTLTASVYSLPGFLPCHDCTNGVITGIATDNSNLKEGNISNYPNPAKGETTVEYELPQGITNGDLVFYTIQGQEVKRFKVTNAFNNIIISTAELDAGTYYYQLQTASGFKAGKKMVVVK